MSKAEKRADETQEEFEQRKQSLDEQEAREQEIEDLLHVMSSRRGRRFVWRLLDYTGLYRQSFTGNSETFFNEGRRNVGLFILDEVTSAAPDQWLQMQREAREAEQSSDDEEESDD